MAASVYSRALQKAADLMGSYAKLARFLQVPASELQNWIADRAIPPTGIFLKAIDFILDETPPPAGSEPADAPAPRDAAAEPDGPSTRY